MGWAPVHNKVPGSKCVRLARFLPSAMLPCLVIQRAPCNVRCAVMCAVQCTLYSVVHRTLCSMRVDATGNTAIA